jgi:hypothetical protein
MTKLTKRIAVKKSIAGGKRVAKSAHRLKRKQARRHPAFPTPHVARRKTSKPAPHAVAIEGGEWCRLQGKHAALSPAKRMGADL